MRGIDSLQTVWFCAVAVYLIVSGCLLTCHFLRNVISDKTVVRISDIIIAISIVVAIVETSAALIFSGIWVIFWLFGL